MPPPDSMSADDIRDRPLRLLLDHWLSWRRNAPDARQIQAADFPDSLLPHLAISTGFLPDGRLKALFTGSIAAMFAGTDPTARYLDELYPPDLYRQVTSVFRLLESRMQPLHGRFALEIGGVHMMESRRLYVPVPDEGGGLAAIIIGIVYEVTEAGRAHRAKVFSTDITVREADIRLLRL